MPTRDPLRPVFGIQDLLKLASVPTGQNALIGSPLAGSSPLTLGPGTWACTLDTGGLQTVEAHVTASAVTGACTLAFNSLHADGGNYQGAAAAAIVANTQQDLSITAKGEKSMVVTIVVPAGGSAGPFTRACFNGL